MRGMHGILSNSCVIEELALLQRYMVAIGDMCKQTELYCKSDLVRV